MRYGGALAGQYGGVPTGLVQGTSITATTGFLAPDGLISAPSIAFGSEVTNGFYRPGAGLMGLNAILGLSGSGALVSLPSDGVYRWTSSIVGGFSGGVDITLARAAANTLVQQNGNNAQEWRVSAGFGAYGGIITVNESLTIAASPTTDSATTIPAGDRKSVV